MTILTGLHRPDDSALSCEVVPPGTLQAKIVSALERAGARGISTDQLIDLLYAASPGGGPEWARTCVYVQVHRLRRKLAPIGLGIDRARRDGRYRLIHQPMTETHP